jgi:hypothetical protein
MLLTIHSGKLLSELCEADNPVCRILRRADLPWRAAVARRRQIAPAARLETAARRQDRLRHVKKSSAHGVVALP